MTARTRSLSARHCCCRSSSVRISVRFQGGPPGRSRRRLGVLAYAPAKAPAPAGPAPVGWRERRNSGRSTRSKFHSSARVRPCSRCRIVRGRPEPVKAVCDRRATAPVKLPGERTREDSLDRTCPDLELAAIGSRDRCGQSVDAKRQPRTMRHCTKRCQRSVDSATAFVRSRTPSPEDAPAASKMA